MGGKKHEPSSGTVKILLWRRDEHPPGAAMKTENPRWWRWSNPSGKSATRPEDRPNPGWVCRTQARGLIPNSRDTNQVENTVLIFLCSTLRNSRKTWFL